MIAAKADDIKSVLCLGAHSDDIEIGCGGTILKLLSQRPDIEVHWIVLSGDKLRAAEAKASAALFLKGSAHARIEIKTFEDACLPYTCATQLKSYFSDLSRNLNPDLIFTHRRDDAHQDHKYVAQLTWQHFRKHWILEYEIPKYDGTWDIGAQALQMPGLRSHIQCSHRYAACPPSAPRCLD